MVAGSTDEENTVVNIAEVVVWTELLVSSIVVNVAVVSKVDVVEATTTAVEVGGGGGIDVLG